VQAHTVGEVGILGTVLLRVYSGTILPIFIEIRSYLTDKEQKISWHSFLRHAVYKHAYKMFTGIPAQACWTYKYDVLNVNATTFWLHSAAQVF